MILIDMAMPKDCYECPCSFMIREGRHEGEEICNILSYAGKTVGECLLGVGERARNCPMRELGSTFMQEATRIEKGLRSTKKLLDNFRFPFSQDADQILEDAIELMDSIFR